jgi:hypothetical protein
MSDRGNPLNYERKVPPLEPLNRFDPTPPSRGLFISLAVAVFVAACCILLFLATD